MHVKVAVNERVRCDSMREYLAGIFTINWSHNLK